MAACRGGHHDIVSLLLEYGAEPTQLNPLNGKCPYALWISSSTRGGTSHTSEWSEITFCLPLPRQNTGQNALHYACQKGDELTASVLIERAPSLVEVKVGLSYDT